jgi:hypothetical protein
MLASLGDVVQQGLYYGHGVMNSHRVGELFGVVVASIAGLPWAKSSSLKMDQRLMEVMTSEVRA